MSDTAQRTSGKAIASLCLGIFSLCIPLVPAALAILLGFLSLSDTSPDGGRMKGRAAGIAGIVLGFLSIPLTGIFCLLALLLPAVQKVRDAADRMQAANEVRFVGIAMHNHLNDFNSFPTSAILDKDGEPLLSWRVKLLPYLEQESLYRQFHLDEPWDSAHNRTLLSKMPRCFGRPKQPTEDGLTHLRVFVGPGTMFEKRPGPNPKGMGIADIPDGTSNTLLVVEASESLPWTKPDELEYAPNKPLPRFGAGGRQFNVLFADGSVRSFPVFMPGDAAKEEIMRAIITRNGGEATLLDPLEK